jgi:hypothetical protein
MRRWPICMAAMLAGAGALAAASPGDGGARRGGVPRSEAPAGAVVFPATGSWYAFSRGHLCSSMPPRAPTAPSTSPRRPLA